MNLKNVIKFTKRFFKWSDQEVSDYLGVSRSQITKINAGYWQGLSCETIRRISQFVRISIDELLENPFFPPSYHISKHIYSVYIKAEKDYPEFNIVAGDYLYIRPFVYDETKLGQLVLVYSDSGYEVEVYDESSLAKPVHFHIVGVTRFLYKPLEGIEYQKKLGQQDDTKRRGAPIKI